MYDVHCVGVWRSIEVIVGPTLAKRLLLKLGAVRLFFFYSQSPRVSQALRFQNWASVGMVEEGRAEVIFIGRRVGPWHWHTCTYTH